MPLLIVFLEVVTDKRIKAVWRSRFERLHSTLNGLGLTADTVIYYVDITYCVPKIVFSIHFQTHHCTLFVSDGRPQLDRGHLPEAGVRQVHPQPQR